MIIISPTNEDYARISQENVRAWVIKNPERAAQLGIKGEALTDEEKHRQKIQKQYESSKKWRQKNPEKVREYHRRSIEREKQTSPEKYKKRKSENTKRWIKQNREKSQAYRKKYYLDNIEKYRAYARKYSVENAEKLREYGKRYRRINKLRISAKDQFTAAANNQHKPKVGASREEVLPLSASECIFFQIVSATNQTQKFAQQLVTQ